MKVWLLEVILYNNSLTFVQDSVIWMSKYSISEKMGFIEKLQLNEQLKAALE